MSCCGRGNRLHRRGFVCEWRLRDGIDVPQTAVFDHPTVADLAGFLARRSVAASKRAAAEAKTRARARARAEAAADSVSVSGSPSPRAPMVSSGPRRFAVVAAVASLDDCSLLADAVSTVPAERWRLDDDPSTLDARFGVFVRDADAFDAVFFGMRSAEAAQADPQHRLLLRVASRLRVGARASVHPETPTTAVTVGATATEYATLAGVALTPLGVPVAATGALNVAAGRVSFAFDLRGFAVAMDTACSSSLVAAHVALGYVDEEANRAACAMGVNLAIAPETTASCAAAGMLSASGRCATLDASADGYVRAEGCAGIAIESASIIDSVAGVAVLRGSAVNQDGKSASLTAPNGPAQARVIAEALSRADVDDPSSVACLSAHGTGTALGDPIEIGAAIRALGRAAPRGTREREDDEDDDVKEETVLKEEVRPPSTLSALKSRRGTARARPARWRSSRSSRTPADARTRTAVSSRTD